MTPHTLGRQAVCLVLFAVLAACSKRAEMAMPEERAVMAKMVDAVAAPEVQVPENLPPAPPKEAPSAGSLSSATTVQQLGSSTMSFSGGEHKFIRTANVRFGVKDVYIAALGIEDAVGSHGGFVVKNDIGAEHQRFESHPAGEGKVVELKSYTLQGHLIVRVPGARTQEFLRAIAGHIVFLDKREYGARDAQFDLLREQLAQIRNQEAQYALSEAVKDGGKLAHKAEAIEAGRQSKEARDTALVARKEFEDQVAYSTIDLTVYQPSRMLVNERTDEEALYRKYRPGFFLRLGQELHAGWDGLLGLLLGLAGIWPFVLILAGATALLWRARRRWRARRAAKAPAPSEAR
jgi:hypothetical protein